MPRGSGKRSLFASLPWDLKKAIRSHSVDPLPAVTSQTSVPITKQVKQELLVLEAADNGYLPTQPRSPTEDVAEVEEEVIEAGPSTVVLPAHLPAKVVASRPGQEPKKKKRKLKGKAVENQYLDHPWDCTGLIKRYQDYSEVPSELTKCAFDPKDWADSTTDFAQRLLYFPLYDSLPLLLDDTGWFSITPQPIASHIAQRCQCDVILDAFCGVGGNAIEFAKTCERVIAIDNDPTRLKLARHNALHCGVADRIDFVLGDFISFARSWSERNMSKDAKERIDVVFLSPPWGGPEYLSFNANPLGQKELPTYPLSAIEPIPGDELFEVASALTPNIAYYLPRNVNISELADLAPSRGPDEPSTKEWVEVEEEWVGDKLKAVTAYYGGLVSEA